MSESTPMESKKARPIYRNINVFKDLPKYNLPLSGKVSILHRISGFGLFLMLPFLVFLLDKSLTSEVSFYDFKEIVAQPWVKGLLLIIIWGYLHHFCAGIRFLLLDLHIGLKKEQITVSAAVVLAVSLALTLVIGLKLFGVF